MLSTVDSSSLVYSLDRAFLFAFVNRFSDVQSSLISYFLLLASHLSRIILYNGRYRYFCSSDLIYFEYWKALNMRW